MKRYLVIWSQVALDAITAAWVAAPSESRDEGRRIWFEYPLGVLYKVDGEKKEVRLLQVWTFKKRS